MKISLSLLGALLAVVTANAGALYVSVDKGNDRAAGSKEAPLRSIGTAIQKAKPGDTVYVLPAGKPIAQCVHFRDVFGTAEKPIVFDGMNNIFVGVRPLKPAEWSKVAPGLYKRTRMDGLNMVNRYFMVVSGRRQQMGRFTKYGKIAQLKDPKELKPGEWTIVDQQPSQKGRHLFDFYIRLADNAPASELARWSEPFLCNGGVQFVGKNANITIRNVIAKHFWNDGFNIHGNAKNIVFENIAAVECGDDGLSGHDNVQIIVRNFAAIGSSTGICHLDIDAVHENIYIEGTCGRDLYFPSPGINTFKNVYVQGDSKGGVWIINKKGKFHAENLVCANRRPGACFHVKPTQGGQATFANCRICGYSEMAARPGVKIEKSIPAGEIAAFKAKLFALFHGQLEKALGK